MFDQLDQYVWRVVARMRAAVNGVNKAVEESTIHVFTDGVLTSPDMPFLKPTKAPLREVLATDENALEEIAESLLRSHKQLVITGAGISTSCGIPDFRSKNGLYKMIAKQTRLPTPPETEPSSPSTKKRSAPTTVDRDMPGRKRFKLCTPDSELSSSQDSTMSSSNCGSSRTKGEDLFNARVFQGAGTTTMFYQFIATLRNSIINDVKDTSETHKFIRALRDGGRLIRCYTQNIDGLEEKEDLCNNLKRGKGTKTRFTKKIQGISRPEIIEDTDFDGGCEVVQLHGELNNLRCRVCSVQTQWTDDETEIFLEGAAPNCESCALKSDLRQAKGKRGLAVGELRPNVVLYGEDHPQNALIVPLMPFDISSNPDVLIIMGTSLKVHGLQKIVRDFAKAVHARRGGRVIFVNRTRPAESVWEGIIDDWVAMDCDDWVCDLKARRPEIWLPQGDPKLLEVKANTLKRKRNSVAELNDRGKKKPKWRQRLSVDIPRIISRPATASDFNDRSAGNQQGFVPLSQIVDNIPNSTMASCGDQTSKQDHYQVGVSQLSRSTRWKHRRSEVHAGLGMFSPRRSQRPRASPLKLLFKPRHTITIDQEYVPGSPITPPFSPVPVSSVNLQEWPVFGDATVHSPSPHTSMRARSSKLVHLDGSMYEMRDEFDENHAVGGISVKRQLVFVD